MSAPPAPARRGSRRGCRADPDRHRAPRGDSRGRRRRAPRRDGAGGRRDVPRACAGRRETWRSGSQPIQFRDRRADRRGRLRRGASLPRRPSPRRRPSRSPRPRLNHRPLPLPFPALEPEADPYPIDALLDGFEPHDGATLIVEDEARPGSGDVLAVRLALRFRDGGTASADRRRQRAGTHRERRWGCRAMTPTSRSSASRRAPASVRCLPLRDLVDRASNDWRCERAVQSLALLRGGLRLSWCSGRRRLDALRRPGLLGRRGHLHGGRGRCGAADPLGRPRGRAAGARVRRASRASPPEGRTSDPHTAIARPRRPGASRSADRARSFARWRGAPASGRLARGEGGERRMHGDLGELRCGGAGGLRRRARSRVRRAVRRAVPCDLFRGRPACSRPFARRTRTRSPRLLRGGDAPSGPAPIR